MGFHDSDYSGSKAFADRRSRFEETGMGNNLQMRGAEASLLVARKELEEIRLDPMPLNSKLKKTGLSGYRRSSVEAYVDELKRSTNQLKDNMEQQIQSLSAECMRLKSESQVLRGQLVQAEEQTNQVRELLAAVTDERDAAEHRVTQADDALKTMESRVSFYESENARIEELKNALCEKTDALDCAAAENGRLKERIRDFSEEAGRIRAELSAYKEKKTAEIEEAASLKQQLRTLQEKNDALSAELDEARQTFSKMSEQEYVNAQNELREENAGLMEKYSGLYAEYKKELARADSLAHENEATSKLMEEYEIRERGYEMLRKNDQEQRTAIEELQKMINGLLDEVQHQQEAYQSLTDERNENKELIYSMTREKSDLQVQNVDLQAQNVELMDKNEELMMQVSKLEEENARLNQQLEPKPSANVLPRCLPEQPERTDSTPENRFSDAVNRLRTMKNFGQVIK